MIVPAHIYGANAMLSFIFICLRITLMIEIIVAIVNEATIIIKISVPKIRPSTVNSFISPPPMPPLVKYDRNKKTAKVIAANAIYILQF